MSFEDVPVLQEMAKHCEHEPEKSTLEKTQIRLQEVVAKLNEDQRKQENREKVLEIQSRFSDKKSVAFLTPNMDYTASDSRFYLEASASQITPDKQEVEVVLFLFHDNLLLARVTKSVVTKSHLKLFKFWPLPSITVYDYTNQEAMAGAIEIVERDDPSQRFWFQLGTKKTKWLSTMEELGVGKDLESRRIGSSPNLLSMIGEEDNWEELYKHEQLKTEAFEEQVQQLEEKCAEVRHLSGSCFPSVFLTPPSPSSLARANSQGRERTIRNPA